VSKWLILLLPLQFKATPQLLPSLCILVLTSVLPGFKNSVILLWAGLESVPPAISIFCKVLLILLVLIGRSTWGS
jgi:hypothetical protein